MLRMSLVVVLAFTLSALSAAAARAADPALEVTPPIRSFDLARLAPAIVGPNPVSQRLLVSPRPQRPIALPALYASFVGLQVFDGYSTQRGLAHGATELNPLMRGIAGNPVALWSVKAATTAGAIYAVERIWKKNKVGAIVVMIAANTVGATVAARNARVLDQLR